MSEQETNKPSPLCAPLCPLCGQANGCAVSAAGSFDAPCWCSAVAFTPGLLARVPPEPRGLACVCRACATKPPPV